MKSIATALTTIVAASVIIPCSGLTVSAKDSGYQILERYGNNKVTAGSYTYKLDKKGKLSISSKGGTAKTAALKPGIDDIAVSSKDLYYFRDNILMRYTVKSGKNEKIKTFSDKPKNGDSGDKVGYFLSASYGDSIYITSESFADWECNTYLFKPGSGKTKKLFNGAVHKTCGKYIIADMEYRTDVSPTTYDLYKITSDGVKKVRNLSKSSYGVYISGGKYFYSTVTEDYSGKKTKRGSKIMVCDADGKNAKTIKELKGNAEFLHFYKDKIYFIEHSEDSSGDYTGRLCELGKDGKGFRVISSKISVFDLDKISGGKVYYGDGSSNYSVDIKTGKISKAK